MAEKTIEIAKEEERELEVADKELPTSFDFIDLQRVTVAICPCG